MEFRAYVSVLARYKWIAMVTFLITIAVTIAGTLLTTPIYAATATLRIMPLYTQSVDYASYLYADRLIRTYSEIATTDSVLDSVKTVLAISELPAISVVGVPETELLRITAQHEDPLMAQRVANTLADVITTQGLQPSDQSASDLLKTLIEQNDTELAALFEKRNALAEQPRPNANELEEVERLIRLKQNFAAILFEDYEHSKMSEALGIATIAVVQYAGLPTSPVSPNSKINLIVGGLVGSVGGVFLALAAHALDTRVFSHTDIQSVAAWPLWATIPKVPLHLLDRFRRTPLLKNDAYREACFDLGLTLINVRKTPDEAALGFLNTEQQQALLEQVNQASAKTLAAWPGIGPRLAQAIVAHRGQYGEFTGIESLLEVPNLGPTRIASIARWGLPGQSARRSVSGNGTQSSPCVVAVISAQPREGKSSLVANLARMLSRLGRSVVVIDADLRRPSQHAQFRLPNKSGLSTVLSGEAAVQDVLQHVGNRKLYVLTSGELDHDPAELLISGKLAVMLSQIKRSDLHADIVLVDTPPLAPVNDALLIAVQADITLFVVCAGVTHNQDVEEVARKLKRHSISQVRMILNRGDRPRSHYHYRKAVQG